MTVYIIAAYALGVAMQTILIVLVSKDGKAKARSKLFREMRSRARDLEGVAVLTTTPVDDARVHMQVARELRHFAHGLKVT